MRQKIYSDHHITFFIIFNIFLTSSSSFAQYAPGDPNAIPIEFRFTHELAPTDSGVGVNGSMNNWLNGIFPMQEVSPNLWKTTLELLPLTYEYKFVTYTDTVGQNGVTAYYTDPLNPRAGGPFNNSFLTVRNPMIYYFLPKSGSTVTTDKPTITANLAVSNSSQLNVNAISFSIDGVSVPNAAQYYNPATKMFSYTPTMGLTFAQHTALIKIETTAGDTASLSTTFTVSGFFSTGPYTFKFDSKSPNFEIIQPITRVDIKADFNSGGNSPMTDPDSDGVYTYTATLNINQQNEYTIIVNTGLYMNDPDNPDLSSNHKTRVFKTLQSVPEFRSFYPLSGASYTFPNDSVVATARLFRSDSAISISPTSLTATHNGSPIPVSWSAVGGGTLDVRATILNPPQGRNIITFNGADLKGNQALPVKYSFGVYPPNSGFHYVDDEDDDKGDGKYLYPNGVPDGSADLQEFHISATPGNDSLEFRIKLQTISPFTRTVLLISNKIDNNYTPALQNIDLRVPEWHNRGIYIILAHPSSPNYTPSEENIIYISRTPLQTGSTIVLNSSSLLNNEFHFKLPLSLLESIMGSYHSVWLYSFFSYLKDSSGSIEITSSLGGKDYTEDSDIYDAGFFFDQKTQERLLANYSSSAMTGGPRVATIGKNQRGGLLIAPETISTVLAQTPDIHLNTYGGILYTDTVTIFGYADVAPGTIINIKVNLSDYTTQTNSSKEFFKQVNLSDSLNTITAFFPLNSRIIKSAPVSFIYMKEKKPVAVVSSSISGSSVVLDGTASSDPEGSTLSFHWSQDPKNPQQVSLGNINSPTVSFTAPSKKGEYYFTLKVTDPQGLTGWTRNVIIISDTGNFTPDLTKFHSRWIDTSIVYSVFVRTFDPAGTFNAITSRMNELQDLGVDCIWFLPIHPTTEDHGPDNPGYAVTDYFDVLNLYGTKQDFRNLVNSAHEAGIKVILDHVIQHTSDLHPFMRDANRFKNHSPFYPFYMWDANNNFIYLFTWVSLPSINYSNPFTRDYLKRIGKYWVQEFDVDGYRCDVAWAINDLRPEGAAFWQSWRDGLKKMKPDAFLLAEADARYDRYFDKKFDAAYDWYWFTNIRSIIGGSSSIASLDSSIQHYLSPAFPKHAIPFKFLESQDEQRFIEAYGVASTKLAASFMFTLPGVPMLYAGQEVGEETYRGIINWTDPHLLRPFYKKLIRIRKDNPALTLGNFQRITNSTPTGVYSYLRVKDSSNALMVYNFSGNQLTTTLNVPLQSITFDSTSSFYLNDVLNNQSFAVTGQQLKNYQVTVPAKSGRIFILSNTPLVGIEDNIVQVPEQFDLFQNYPNPFNPSTTIRYSLPVSGRVQLSVFSILGEKVADIVNTNLPAGHHSAVFDGSDFASGVYFFRIEVHPFSGGDAFTAVKKMVLVK